MFEDLVEGTPDDFLGRSSNAVGFGLESDRFASGAEHADIVFSISYGKDVLGQNVHALLEKTKRVNLVISARTGAPGAHGRSKGDAAGGFSLFKLDHVGKSEVCENAAANDFRGDVITVTDDADAIAELAEADNGGNCAGNERYLPSGFLKRFDGNAAEDAGDPASPILRSEVEPIQIASELRGAPGALREFNDKAAIEKGPIHVEQSKAIDCADLGDHLLWMRADDPFSLLRFAGERNPQPSKERGAVQNGASHLGRHFAENVEIMAVMFDVTDIDFGNPRAETDRIEEKADIHTVIVFEAETGEEVLASGDNAGKRLIKVSDFWKVSSQERPGRKHRDATGATGETRFDKVSLPIEHGLTHFIDQVVGESGEVAVQIEKTIRFSFEKTILHRGAFSEHRTGDHACAGVLGELGGPINGAIIDDDDFAHQFRTQRELDHARDALTLVQNWDDDGNSVVRWSGWRENQVRRAIAGQTINARLFNRSCRFGCNTGRSVSRAHGS